MSPLLAIGLVVAVMYCGFLFVSRKKSSASKKGGTPYYHDTDTRNDKIVPR